MRGALVVGAGGLADHPGGFGLGVPELEPALVAAELAVGHGDGLAADEHELGDRRPDRDRRCRRLGPRDDGRCSRLGGHRSRCRVRQGGFRFRHGPGLGRPRLRHRVRLADDSSYVLHCLRSRKSRPSGPTRSQCLPGGPVADHDRFAELGFALNVTGLAVLDEIDGDLHVDIAGEILRWFRSRETNPNNAQLLVTSHNVGLLDDLEKEEVFIEADEQDGKGQGENDQLRTGRNLSGAYRRPRKTILQAVGLTGEGRPCKPTRRRDR